MAFRLPHLEELPRRNATEAKNHWGGLVRDVREHGTVAITSHNKVEVVILEAARYQEMAALVGNAEARRQAALGELSAEFDRHLASLEAPDARARVEAVMEAKGRAKVRSKAGASF